MKNNTDVIWKPIQINHLHYIVSNTAIVLNEKWEIMKEQTHKQWYKRVALGGKAKGKLFLVHRIVAHAFLWLDIYDTSIKVCHKDDNVSNNHLDNLFLWTQADNVRDMWRKWRDNNLFRLRNPNIWRHWLGKYAPRARPIIQLSIDGTIIREWECAATAERELWICSQSIRACCRWVRNKCNGYKWKFIN